MAKDSLLTLKVDGVGAGGEGGLGGEGGGATIFVGKGVDTGVPPSSVPPSVGTSVLYSSTV